MIARNPMCPRCGERPKHGTQSWCKPCCNAYQRARYAKRRAGGSAVKPRAKRKAKPTPPTKAPVQRTQAPPPTSAAAPTNRVADALKRTGRAGANWRVMVADWGTGWRLVAEGDRVRCEAEYRERKLEHVFVRLYADGEVVATHRAGAKRARRRRKAKRT